MTTDEVTESGVTAAIDEDLQSKKRAVVLNRLASRLDLKMGQINTLLTHPQYGPIVADLTLQEIIDAQASEPEAPAAKPKKKVSKKGKKKKTAKQAGKKKATKKTTKKASKKVTKKASRVSLDYDEGCKTVFKAIAAVEDIAKSEIVAETGLSEKEVNAYLKQLIKEKQVNKVGGGRGTKYAAA